MRERTGFLGAEKKVRDGYISVIPAVRQGGNVCLVASVGRVALLLDYTVDSIFRSRLAEELRIKETGTKHS